MIYMFKWLFGIDEKEAKEEQLLKMDTTKRIERLAACVAMLDTYLQLFNEKGLSERCGDLMDLIKGDMKALGWTMVELNLDYSLVLCDKGMLEIRDSHQ